MKDYLLQRQMDMETIVAGLKITMMDIVDITSNDDGEVIITYPGNRMVKLVNESKRKKRTSVEMIDHER